LDLNKLYVISRVSKKLLLFLGFSPLLLSCEQILDEITDARGSLQKIFDLPSEIPESSGLILYDSLLWTFNDSDNGVYLFGVDLDNGSKQKIITLQNAENADWEDISQDESSIFIGDIGNSVDRDSMTIYILKKSDIDNNYEQDCSVNKLRFIFEDQANYSPGSYSTAYDCEALIAIDDSLYVFTKDWVNSHSVIYSIPKTPGSYAAKRIAEFNSHGLVTGAGYNRDKNQIAICGYNNYIPFILLIDISNGFSIDDRAITRFDFIEQAGVQIEGIDYLEDKIYVTSENSAHPQAFYEFMQK
jgi:hypothetical protein